MFALKMKLRHPAPGVSSAFDALSAEYGPEVAFRSILRRAFADYLEAIADGSFVDAPRRYREGEHEITTSRRLSRGLYRRAATRLDPAGVLSERMLGSTIGRSALAAFFETEGKRTPS